MEKVKHYSIHGIVGFKILGTTNLADKLLSGIFGRWDIELQGFARGGQEEPDLAILIGKFVPDNRNCVILDDDYYIREDYLYCRDHLRYAKWQLEMSGFEQGAVTVHVHSNVLGKMLIPEMIINHLIWFKLNNKGYPVVHASAVSKDEKAYVFAAQGAAGKSTVALSLLESGFRLLSEHFVILNQGDALSFPTPFHVTGFNRVPIISNNMTLKHRASFQVRQLLRYLTGRGIATKILPDEILPNSLAHRAKLHAIFLLLPRENLKVERMGKEELLGHLVMNQRLESFPFIRYMMEYAYLFPQSAMANYWAQYEANLRRALDSVENCYRVEVPQRYDSETLQKIAELVERC